MFTRAGSSSVNKKNLGDKIKDGPPGRGLTAVVFHVNIRNDRSVGHFPIELLSGYYS